MVSYSVVRKCVLVNLKNAVTLRRAPSTCLLSIVVREFVLNLSALSPYLLFQPPCQAHQSQSFTFAVPSLPASRHPHVLCLSGFPFIGRPIREAFSNHHMYDGALSPACHSPSAYPTRSLWGTCCHLKCICYTCTLLCILLGCLSPTLELLFLLCFQHLEKCLAHVSFPVNLC